MNILITGSQGYIGSSIGKKLKEYFPDCKINGLDIGYFHHLNLGTDIMPEIFFSRIIFKDIRNIQLEDLSGIDTIVHLAAISNDPMGNNFSITTAEINYIASVRLAKIAKNAKVKKFIFASSASVYGKSSGVCDENTKINPLTTYAESKVNTEIELLALADTEFQVTCLRFATACGWTPRIRSDLVLNQFVLTSLLSKKIQLNSDGEARRPLISTEDMGRAVAWACSNYREALSQFEIINIGQSEWNFKIIDLAEMIKKLLINYEIEIEIGSEQDKRSYELSFEKYKKNCGEFKLIEDISETIMNLKNNYEKIINFDKNDYLENGKRLNSINRLVENRVLDEKLQIIR